MQRDAREHITPLHLQVMPQLLNHLQQDEMDPAALDWGTIVVYTCSKSCGPPNTSKYVEEFVWVQPA